MVQGYQPPCPIDKPWHGRFRAVLQPLHHTLTSCTEGQPWQSWQLVPSNKWYLSHPFLTYEIPKWTNSTASAISQVICFHNKMTPVHADMFGLQLWFNYIRSALCWALGPSLGVPKRSRSSGMQRRSFSFSARSFQASRAAVIPLICHGIGILWPDPIALYLENFIDQYRSISLIIKEWQGMPWNTLEYHRNRINK